MSLRGFTIGDYHTGEDWRMILNSKDLTPAEPKTYLVDLDGRDGSLDLSESLAGEVKYKDRTLKAGFILTEGTRREREDLIREITNYINGKKRKIVDPDDLDHYLVGRIKITAKTNTQAYGTLSIEATCEPWRYLKDSITRYYPVNAKSTAPVKLVFFNRGAKTVCPTITVTGIVTIIIKGVTTQLSAGSYKITDLKLYSGSNEVNVYGSGSVTFSYEEADL